MWVKLAEAAARLNTSERTIHRKIQGGELVSRKRGGRVEVEIDSQPDVSVLSGMGRRLADIEQAHIVVRNQEQATIAAVIKLAEQARDDARQAERRLYSAIRWTVGTAALLTIVLISAATYAGITWAAREAGHAGELATLRARLSDRDVYPATEPSIVQGRLPKIVFSAAQRSADTTKRNDPYAAWLASTDGFDPNIQP